MRRAAGLDALRGLASLVVATMHVAAANGLYWLPGGYLAVDLFFVINGFVIARIYTPAIDRGMTLRDFTQIRLQRLYPLFLLGVLAGALVIAARIAVGRGDGWRLSDIAFSTVASAIGLPQPGMPQLYPLNPPLWSLIFELAVNIVYVASGQARRSALKVAAVSGAALIAIAGTTGSLDVGANWATAVFGLARVSFSFFMGVAIAEGAFANRASIKLFTVAIALTTLSLTAFARPAFDLLFVLLLSPTIVAAAAVLPTVFRPLEKLGQWSYALYVLHGPTMLLGHGLIALLAPALEPELATVAILSGCIVIAAIAAELVEAPLAAIRRRRPRVTNSAEAKEDTVPHAGVVHFPTAPSRGEAA